MSTPTIPDLPEVDPKNPDSLRRFMGALKEIVQTREGRRGQKLDKAVTFRDLQGIGIVQQQPNTGGFVPGPATGGGGGTGGGSGSTDLSPAPAVDLASVSVTAGFASIFIEWAAQTYTTGGGNAYTEVWAATYSGTGPLPTFADAKLVNLSEAPLFAYTVGLGVQVHVWLINVTRAGKPQLVPTGGTNGKSATTGKIGSTDLAPLIIEAQHMKDQSVIQRVIAEKAVNYQQLADGAVRVQHLLVAPTSLVVDPTFAQGTAGWSAVGASGYFVARYHKSHPAVPSPSLLPTDYAAVFAGRDAQMLTRLKVEPGEQYKASVLVYKPDVLASTGWVALFFDANGSYWAGHVAQTSSSAPWFRVEDSFTVPAGAVSMSVAPWNGQDHGGTIGSWFANLQVEKKNDASLIVDGSIWAQHLRAGAIAVGTAAIADGALVNAMIADATIEDAKIKTLSADKITAGRIAVGQYIASAGFNSGYSGWAIWGNGDAQFNNVTVRGTVYANAGAIGGIIITDTELRSSNWQNGAAGFLFRNSDGHIQANNVYLRGSISSGAFGDYAWPSDPGGLGFFLGYQGLLLGNPAQGRYFQVTNAGNVYTPRMVLEDGNAYFSGRLEAATGTFSGSMTADAVNAVNTINIAGGAVTLLSAPSGSGNAASVPCYINVPAGNTYSVVVIGYQQSWSALDSSYPSGGTLSVSGPTGSAGVSYRGAVYAYTGESDSGPYGPIYAYDSVIIVHVMQLDPGFHAIYVNGMNGAPKTVVCVVSKR